MSRKGGFRVLVPDLYHGSVGTDKEEASHVRTDCMSILAA